MSMGLVGSLFAALFSSVGAVLRHRFLYDPLGFSDCSPAPGYPTRPAPNSLWNCDQRLPPGAAPTSGIDLHKMRRLIIIASEPASMPRHAEFAATFAGVGLAPTALGSGWPGRSDRRRVDVGANAVPHRKPTPPRRCLAASAAWLRCARRFTRCWAGTIKLRGDGGNRQKPMWAGRSWTLDEGRLLRHPRLGFLWQTTKSSSLAGRTNSYPRKTDSLRHQGYHSRGIRAWTKSHVQRRTCRGYWKAHWTASSTRPKPTD